MRPSWLLNRNASMFDTNAHWNFINQWNIDILCKRSVQQQQLFDKYTYQGAPFCPTKQPIIMIMCWALKTCGIRRRIASIIIFYPFTSKDCRLSFHCDRLRFEFIEFYSLVNFSIHLESFAILLEAFSLCATLLCNCYGFLHTFQSEIISMSIWLRKTKPPGLIYNVNARFVCIAMFYLNFI